MPVREGRMTPATYMWTAPPRISVQSETRGGGFGASGQRLTCVVLYPAEEQNCMEYASGAISRGPLQDGNGREGYVLVKC